MDRQRLIRRAALASALVTLALPLLALGALRFSGWRAFVEQTGSMAPALDVGELVVVTPLRAQDMRPGDVVTFRDPWHGGSRTITHRVVRVRPAGPHSLAVTTRGDANRGAETWNIARRGTVGRLRLHLPLPAFVRALTGHTPARGVVMALLTLIALAATLSAIWSRPKSCAPSP